MGIRLSDATLRLLDGKNYAVEATVNPDGSPQTSVVWIGRHGGDLLFSTVEGRVKHRNMLRDPRVSVTVIGSSDPENYVELRGRRLDTQLSWKYDGKEPDPDRPGAVRVVVRIVVKGHRIRRITPAKDRDQETCWRLQARPRHQAVPMRMPAYRQAGQRPPHLLRPGRLSPPGPSDNAPLTGRPARMITQSHHGDPGGCSGLPSICLRRP